MLLSKRTQYGVRALICLADAYEHGYLQAKELADREKLPIKFLESIMAALTRGKFLTSKIGASGGYRLSRSPKQITLAEVVLRLEGKDLMADVPEPHPGERPGEIGVRLIQESLSESIQQVMANTTLARLAEQVAQQGRGTQMYYI